VLAGELEVVLDGDVADEAPCGELGELFGRGVPDGEGRAGVEEEEEAVEAEESECAYGGRDDTYREVMAQKG
jgi:hypothetical protein